MFRKVYLSPDTGSGTGDEGENTEDTGSESSASNADMLKALGSLNEGLEKLPGVIATAVQSALPKAPAEEEEDEIEPLPELDDQELDRLPRKEFEKRLLARVSQDIIGPLSKQIKDLSGGVESVSIETQKDRLVRELEVVRSADPETFEAMKAPLADILKRFPSMASKDAMDLARAQNPKIVEEVAVKKKEAAKESGEAPEEAGDQPAFSGFFPTSTPTSAQPKQQRKGHMKLHDASTAAFDKVFGSNVVNIGNT